MSQNVLPSPLQIHAGLRLSDGAATEVEHALPEETPIAMVFDGSTQAVMMASPKDLEDFAIGFALTEGIISQMKEVQHLEIHPHEDGIEARFWLSNVPGATLIARRRAMAGPVGCGLCGIDSLAQAVRPLPDIAAELQITTAEILQATDLLRAGQTLHQATRATHAAGFLQPGKGLTHIREDVGRHNALDKLLGALLREGVLPASGAIVMTSRVSVELIQKAAIAGCPVLVAVSAPTALALRLATQTGLTLVALARGGAAHVFSHPQRILGLIQS